MLDRIYIQRFKKFQDLEVYLRPFTVLMGENSSGKTTVLQAINLALSSFFIHQFIYIDNNSNLKIKDKGVGLNALPGLSISDYREVFYSKKSGSKISASIGLVDTTQNIYKLQIRSFFGAFNIKCNSEELDLANNPQLHLKSPLFISGFVGLLSSEERAFPVAIQDRLRSGQVSAIIRNLLLDTKVQSPTKFTSLKERLQRDFNFYLDDISFDQNRDLNISAYYSDLCAAQKISLDFNSSGSGFMQVLQILAPIYRFCPEQASVVLLDEPDAHLHPNLQASLANTLRGIQKELGIQIIISTHSTSIIRAADPSEVIPISSQERVNKPLVGSDDVEDQISARIDTYDLGKSVISGKLVFLEDSDTSILEAFDKVLSTGCFSGANTVPVLKGRSKDDKVPFQMNEVLNEFVGREVEIHFVRDGDGISSEWREKLNEYANKRNVILHQLKRHEIENYLLSPSLIFKALTHNHPDKNIPSEEMIKTKIVTLLQQTIGMSKYSFDDNLEDSIYKTALLLKIQEYRNPQACESESKKQRARYETYENIDELLTVGMGKETLRGIMAWLNDDLKLNLSKNDILKCLEPSDIPEEIKNILEQLRSKESKSSPMGLPKVVEEIEDDEIDEEEPE
ncbi:AAA family ATPase [Nostoc spongiaeforme FACHB-130]|uniref:AAA family ATPase n=1 Tax=Nostoc spongiaeforme FACHB-130 TaxID=1357510 RepID=A0ABR8G3W2_9NOSO|nr:ATP-binding protein [Nostoc spongiaeforme]MBD2597908.1 AAA family ATPase [Nostoc spongiaeforme FACHB-130]